MGPWSRILCAVDIDERSTQVLEHAVTLARRHDAKLLIVHAVSPVAYSIGAAKRVELLRDLRLQAEAADVDARVTVQQGPADEIILLHATARTIDLIVIGTSRQGSRRGLSGWIAERVLRDAPCPTFVVPERATDPTAFMRPILCAVDFSSASPAVVAEAVRLADHGRQRVTLIHVASGRGDAALDKLQSFIPPRERGVVSAQVVGGRPVDEIVRASREMNAQLLVIGVGRRSAVGSRLFGKTGQLLRGATCPILAVPAASTADAGTERGHAFAA